MIVIQTAAAVLGLVVVYLIAKRALRNSRRKRLMAVAFPDEYKQIIEKNVPLYRHLREMNRVEVQQGG